MTFWRMYLRHAGSTSKQTMMPMQSCTISRMLLLCDDFSETDSTPPSKQCSQEKPTRMPRELIMILTISLADSCWSLAPVSSPLGTRRAFASPSASVLSTSLAFSGSWASKWSSTLSTMKTMTEAKAVRTKAMITFSRIAWVFTLFSTHHHWNVHLVAQSTHHAEHMPVALSMVFSMRVRPGFWCLFAHLYFCMTKARPQASSPTSTPRA
mmetsp:Transcript_70107/g.182739  ORF Transcript_70107/g.182739 Transcript_70107/m.182739 type:complete len:210 (-) Transcript_70107:1120-1749(-)